ncbi:MAG: tRNA pseudouridine(55) synthase TruB [Gemmatimonadetes bacterium]|nr:tRNA pseudouridine(55) synthase TruB [Gemmatimonadota bacterium]
MLSDGLLLVDKPAGPTSHDVVAIVRRAFRTRRVGHAGTLDPFATGLLVVLVGYATRLAQFVSDLPKLYTGAIGLGTTTDTDDASGTPLRASDAWRHLGDPAIAQAMQELTGARQQVPPAYSAKHVAGERAHRRARRGEAVTLHPVAVEITRFDLTGRDGPFVRFAARVSSGTYIRSLARELGELLGCGAHLASLRRHAVGPFVVEDAVALDRGADVLREALRPPQDAVRHLPAATVDEAACLEIGHGRAVPVAAAAPGPAALVAAADGRLVAIADVVGGEARPRVVLAP